MLGRCIDNGDMGDGLISIHLTLGKIYELELFSKLYLGTVIIVEMIKVY